MPSDDERGRRLGMAIGTQACWQAVHEAEARLQVSPVEGDPLGTLEWQLAYNIVRYAGTQPISDFAGVRDAMLLQKLVAAVREQRDQARAQGAADRARLERLTQAADAFDTAWRAGDGDDIETCDAADVLRYELRAQREAAHQPTDAGE